MKPKIFPLIAIDDEPTMHAIYKILFKEYLLYPARSIAEARDILRKNYVRVALLDLGLPAEQGIEFIPELREQYGEIEVIVVTSDNSAISGVRAMKLGALDYVVKPFDNEDLLGKVNRLREDDRRLRVLEAYNRLENDDSRPLLGESPAILNIRKQISLAAKSDAPVLIQGESGTGKELVARSIHAESERGAGPFIGVNCGAFAESLLDSELFGHEKGSFTGAIQSKKGRFELANEGVLFLDELCSMSLAAQAKMLRVIEESLLLRVGAEKEIPVNVRIIAATNSNMSERIAEKKFREDLFYRLNVIPIYIPALRERGDDILLLAKYFLQKYNTRYGKKIRSFSTDLEVALRVHKWKGNVRELNNCIHRLVINCDGEVLTNQGVVNFGILAQTNLPEDANLSLTDAQNLFRREFIESTMKRVGDDVKKAADILRVHPATIYRILSGEVDSEH